MAISVSVIAVVVGLCLLMLLAFTAVVTWKRRCSKKAWNTNNNSRDPRELSLTLPSHIPTTISYIYPDFRRLSSTSGDVSGIDAIDPKLYEEFSGVEQKDTSSSPGRLCFNVAYEEQTERLVVAVFRGENIRPKTSNPIATPYVKIWLLPDMRKKLQTKTRQKTPNPVFNEEFVFHCPISDLKSRCLKFTVCDFDRFSRQNVIGDVTFPLDENYDRIMRNNENAEEWKDIEDLEATCSGSVLFSMQYLPTAERLAIVILKGKCFEIDKDAKDSAVHVKVTMTLGGRTTRSKKTSKTSKTPDSDPVFNESFHFDIPETLLDRTSFTIAVVNNKSLLGRVVVGPYLYATGSGLAHWNDMVNSPRNAVAQWHALH